MTKHAILAIHGGEPAIRGPLEPYDPIGMYKLHEIYPGRGPLSGYLGGVDKGGYWCEKLEEMFREALGVKHAIVVNSATSGILAACVVANIGRGSSVGCSPYTMSASVAPALFLGASVKYHDIDAYTFNMKCDPAHIWSSHDALIVPNIFGHPAELSEFRKLCDQNNTIMIEDNAQSPFATEYGKYAGTIGHIGVFSLNVHKHIHCGEGGVVVTNDDDYAHKIRGFRNHSELSGGSPGLNLRMTELSATVACALMESRARLINSRINFAEELTEIAEPYDAVMQYPMKRVGCKHVYYTWALQVPSERDWFVSALKAEGMPISAGYSILPDIKPAMEVPCWHVKLPVTYAVDKRIAMVEICANDPTHGQMKQIKEAFDKVSTELQKRLASME